MKSILLFLLTAFILAGCSSKSDKSYKEEGDKLKSEGNITGAIASYEALIKEFPESKLAPVAMGEIANLYQENKVKQVSGRESLEKAAQIFRELYNKYPKSSVAPKALFTSAFILANQLGRFPEATETYKLFIEKFPNHELVKSAQLELDNMGLTPDEILRKKDANPNI